MHKIDLLTDEQMASYSIQAGDILTLDVPDGKGDFNRGDYHVSAVDFNDAGQHPDTGEHLTRVTLTLESSFL
jgi:hypothetical protein